MQLHDTPVINIFEKSSFPSTHNKLKLDQEILWQSSLQITMYSFSMVCKKLVLKFFLLTGQPLHCQPNLNQHQRQVKLYKNGLSISISYISISISDSSLVWAPLPELLLEFLGRSLISTSAASSNSPDGDQDDDDEGDEEEEEESDDDDCDHNNFESSILMTMTITFSFSCSLSRSAACLKSPFTYVNTMTKTNFTWCSH